MPRHLLLPLCLLLAATARGEDNLGIRVPLGFEVALYADDTLAHDIYSMTIDSAGRVVVAGAGYVKTLHDDDGDGRADRATLFAEMPHSGAHGMYFDGPDLVCTGDRGVHRLRDRDGDGRADGEVETWTALNHPEHGANGIVRGPDGCFYLICGNDAGISPEHAVLATSPVKQPRSGGIVRFAPDGSVLDVYAHGFRNPYDLTFDARGRIFTVDSDGERDHHLPWYAPTRLFDVAQGMEHGWLLKGWTQSWNRPESFFDNVERAAEIGRGSPTGLVAYRHRQFPEHYQGGVFAACWTFGRVYYFPLTERGASCTAPVEIFMETTGDVGFAPCDLAVGPEGDLFVAIGGRRTRGSVFRVHSNRATPKPRDDDHLLNQVLLADQPLASWSRARWVPQAQQVGQQFFEQTAATSDLDADLRVRAIEVLVEVFGGLDSEVARRAIETDAPLVRARIAWALGRSAAVPAAVALLCQLTDDADPVVQRYAWEALATMPGISTSVATQPAWARGLNSPLRRVRRAAIAVAGGVGAASYEQFLATVRIPETATRLRLAPYWIEMARSDELPRFDAERLALCASVAGDAGAGDALRLEAVRLVQLALGDIRLQDGVAEVYAGYQGRADEAVGTADRAMLADRLAPVFPSGEDELDRESARLLGMLGAEHPGLLDRLANKWTTASRVEDDIHYLIVASLIGGPREQAFTAATVRCLLGLHGKLTAAGEFTSRNWPYRVGEVFDELCRRDPALAAEVAASEQLRHPAHALFVDHLSESLRPEATLALWQRVLDDGAEPTAEMVALAGELPAQEALPLLRPQWEEGALRDAVVLVLARYPRDKDREKFIAALDSPQPQVVEAAAKALVALGVRHTPAEMATALRALKQACSLGKQLEPRTTLMRLLEFWTEDGADVEWDPDPARYWVGWYELFAGYYPAEYARLKASSSTDLSSWRERLADVNWTSGNADAGRQVFELRSCHRCHQQSGHLGPELKGAVTRMSREDLFTAILDPNAEVSPAYMTTSVATDDGQVYHGLVVYESPEGTLLQTGPDTTVRITSTEAAALRPSPQSLMPTGLLDPLTDEQLADLYAYLKTLAGN